MIPTRTVWKPHLHWLVADWPELMQPTRGEVAPRDNVEAPPHPRSIGSHPRIRNLSISLQRQQIGDENADPSGRYRLAWCGNPNPTGYLLIGRGSWSQRTAKVAPRDSVEVPSHPGRIGSHPQLRNSSISLQLHHPGEKTGIPPVDTAPHGVETPTPLADC